MNENDEKAVAALRSFVAAEEERALREVQLPADFG